MGHQVTVAYYSTTQGVTQQQTGSPAVYYGRVFAIPKALFSEEGEVDFQADIQELIEELQAKGMSPILDGATIERYETWNGKTDEVWVMYRVPCRPPEMQAD